MRPRIKSIRKSAEIRIYDTLKLIYDYDTIKVVRHYNQIIKRVKFKQDNFKIEHNELIHI